MSGITSDNNNSNSTPELLEHDRKGAALAVCIDEWRYSQPVVSSHSFVRQAKRVMTYLIEVFSNSGSPRTSPISPNPPAQERYDLLSKEVSLGGLEWPTTAPEPSPTTAAANFLSSFLNLDLSPVS